jgi:hypothetical protein
MQQDPEGREVCAMHPMYTFRRRPSWKCAVCLEIFRKLKPCKKRGRKLGGKNKPKQEAVNV